MSPKEDQNFIEVLPEEVLSEIFKWLDVESVKNASLVCQQWNRIIFSNHSIRRFCLVLDTDRLHTRTWEILSKHFNAYSKWSHRKRKQFRREMRHEEIQQIVRSQRCYRSLLWRQSLEKVQMYMFKSLYPWKTEHLHTLKVEFSYREGKKEILKLLESVIRVMPQLHSLKLVGSHNSVSGENVWVVLHSKTVRNLRLQNVCEAIVDMPALQTLTVDPETIYQAAHNFPLENLKELTFKSLYFLSELNINIYRRLMKLETMRFRTYVREEEFLAVCEHCTMLKELVIYSCQFFSEERAFNHLTKLTNLRRLSLKDIYFLVPGTVRGTDFAKLSNLEYLKLTGASCTNILVLKLPQSITTVEFTITPQIERTMMRLITSSLAQLKILRIHMPDDFSADDHAPFVTLRILHLLTNLEVFEFAYGYFSKSCLLNINAPMHRLRKLHLIECKIDTIHLKGLHDKFPKLKQLGFKNCYLTSRYLLEDIYQYF